ncbi:mycofactocin biosynthesis glycosyltransferase MftF [Nocardia wallacei]|uniref:mycofactocin biosynthesis glycosyltransferase MftF n=1 Tax=Nocardia wallacei TaxID=480035 RepID=UPI002457522C|nr:mycofactocin biosynthesis glycosyltransferase MftF [Nocardia wallacei]
MKLQLDARVRRVDNGRVLLGGAPTRVLRLRARGTRLLDAWLAGDPVDSGTPARTLARRLLDAGIVHPVAERAATSTSLVTLVVPVKDNPGGLARLLDATTEIADRIVVDDGSRIPVADAAVRHRGSRGPAAARNAGWHRATMPFVAFLDSDTVPAPGWLDGILPLFDDPGVAAVAPRIRSLPIGPVGPYEARRSALDMGSEPAVVRPGGRVRYVPAAALVVRGTALREIGGFDESLRLGEDVDLVWRLVSAGHTVRYQPLSTVHHEPRPGIRAFVRQRFGYGTAAAALARRHPGLLDAARMSPGAGAQAVLAATGHPAAAVLPAAVRTLWTMRRLRPSNVPVRDILVLTAAGQLSLARQLADALRRLWWPLALCSRRGRRLLRAAWLAAAAESLFDNSDVTLRFADELAYGIGVWAGCVRHRTFAPLLPRIRRTPKGSAS